MLAQTFTEQTLGLLRVITDAEPESIRETARLVERDVKNVHEELARLETMGVILVGEQYDSLGIIPGAVENSCLACLLLSTVLLRAIVLPLIGR